MSMLFYKTLMTLIALITLGGYIFTEKNPPLFVLVLWVIIALINIYAR